MNESVPTWLSVAGFSVLLLLTVAIIVIAVLLHFRKKKRFDVSKISITDIDRMSGHDFEDYLYVLFVALGYDETFLTKKSRDFGADLLFRDRLEAQTVVQAKRITEKIGLEAIQEIYAAKAYYDANQAIVITSAIDVSEPCRKLAAATKVRILAREDLIEVIRLFKKGRLTEAQDVIELPYEEIDYNAEDSIDDLDHQRGLIKAGEYFYKLTKTRQSM
ncbi:restriction endonuclease [Halalkalibacter alkaliphilus]|uniref:Restriction endonuclease n=1 Tax=Halalkalibacter alkaliphilus TaxID=2917993 RepID=A0A9X2CTD8_9BACI|nr:restriction endonuclease [Halalkalibacter alkaliphilus]MCL7747898.1 restriction endonuclease [Halalkalibacter alkaliphilus]